MASVSADDGTLEPGPARPGHHLDGAPTGGLDLETLVPLVRRVVGARAATHPDYEDLVQETITRVLSAAPRIAPGMVEPYAITTARNVVAGMYRSQDRNRRHQHRYVEVLGPPEPGEELVVGEDRSALASALARLGPDEQALLLAHEVEGQDTRSLAQDRDSTAGAVAAALNRARARLRVEYLVVQAGREPPGERCRPVLRALSGGQRRRQQETGVAEHLLGCSFCRELSPPLLGRGRPRDDEVRVSIDTDADVVTARQAARDLAARSGLTGSDLTVLATAVSEVSRNIVQFAGSGQLVVELAAPPRGGVRVVARDRGPGIADLDAALRDGYSTSEGLGLGLPGCRRLMDLFEIHSSPEEGTTVTMAMWPKEGRR